MPDVPGVSSTPAVPVLKTPPDLATLSPSERNEWRKSGNLPDATPKKPDASAVSSPAEPVVQAAESSVDESASEPTHPKTKARFDRLLAERKAAADEVAELRRQLALKTAPVPDVTAVSSPAPTAAPELPATRVKPSEDEVGGKYPTYAAFIEDLNDWKDEQRTAKVQAERALQEQLASQHQTVETFSKQIEAVGGRAFMDTIAPEIRALKPREALGPNEPFTPYTVVADELVRSPQAPALMKHFTDHPEVFASFGQPDPVTGRLKPPVQIIRELAVLQAQIGSVPTSSVNTITSAPEPPPTLGSRPAQAGDAEAAALRSRDFLRYRETVNAKERPTVTVKRR